MLKLFCLLVSLSISIMGLAQLSALNGSVAVKLDNGTFFGITTGSMNKFLGIPFAQPPYAHIRSTFFS